jgi:hypothetical protein
LTVPFPRENLNRDTGLVCREIMPVSFLGYMSSANADW